MTTVASSGVSMELIGFSVGDPRLPLTPLTPENTERLKKLLPV